MMKEDLFVTGFILMYFAFAFGAGFYTGWMKRKHWVEQRLSRSRPRENPVEGDRDDPGNPF